MSDELVHVEDEGSVRTITLDSQHNRNALSRQLVRELLAAVRGAGPSSGTSVVRLQAEGRAFCAGADLREMTSGDRDARADGTQDMLALFTAIVESPCPVVARVHAPVRAGGIGIVAAADVAIASVDASFAISEVRLALAPATISLTVGRRMHDRARSLTWLTGETFDGARAAELGLVTESVSADRLDARVDEIVAAMASNPAQGLAETKRLLTADMARDIEQRGQDLAELSSRLFGTDEAQSILRAFLDRGR